MSKTIHNSSQHQLELTIKSQIQTWLEKVVIGLNLCPFAKRPYKQNQVHIVISSANNDDQLLSELSAEINSLISTPITEKETSIIVVSNHLLDFYEYNDFLDSADYLLKKNNWQGQFQIASFHPDYQFSGTKPDDSENLTNRSPYPLLHILRESSLDKAVDSHPNVDQIPDDNINKMNQLTKTEIAELFAYLKD